MNKNKGVMIRICLLIGLCSVTLGISSLHLHKNNFNEDKLRDEKKVLVNKLNTKVDKKDDYSVFKQIVKKSEAKRIKDESVKQEKLKQQKLVIAKKKAELIQVNKKIVYNPYNLSEVSNITNKKLHKILGNTTMAGLEESFIQAEKEYHVNALFLVSLVATESSWNTSERANNGSNNLTGFSVYHNASRGGSFDTKGDCIMKTARLIKEDYLNTDGINYNGKSIWNVNMKYCETSKWSGIINSIANGLVNK